MSANPLISAQMRERWSRPEWRKRQLAAIEEGLAKPHVRKRGRPLKPKCERKVSKSGDKVKLNFWADVDLYDALAAQAMRTNESLSELIRKYAQWGLDEEAGE